MQSPITTHVLDTTRGRPAAGVILELAYHSDPDAWQVLARGTTDDDGRNSNLLSGNAPLKTGVYRLTFEVADYFKQLNVDTFYPYVAIVFNVGHPDQYFHVPLLLSPFGYSTYRGS